MSIPLSDLQDDAGFVRRHVGTTAADQAAMLEVLGCADLDELLDQAVPSSIVDLDLPGLPEPASEAAVLAELRALADRNAPHRSCIGLGYHGTITPPVIQRNVLENPAWYTAYTPYQPEISQGRLEVLLNFQTMVSDLTGMDIANASLLDEATAVAEAMTLCLRLDRTERTTFVLDADVHPQTVAVVRTRGEAMGITVEVRDVRGDVDGLGDDVYAVMLQQPTSSGAVPDDRALIAALHERDAQVVVSTDLLACTLVTPPGEQGADVVVGSSQRFGVPMLFGGPHAAFMAVRESARRALPGRLVGVSVDAAGRRALRLALQTREQHIRREKATSNICTSQVLLAVVAALYAQYHGPDGLRQIARRVHRSVSVLAHLVSAAGHTVVNDTFFDTLTVEVADAAATIAAARAAGYDLRPVDATHVGVTFDETTTIADVAEVARAFGAKDVDVAGADGAAADGIPSGLMRTSAFLTHPVFHSFRSETAMMRELRRLADRDIALDRSMIPLGSCTMKLNAATEMAAVTWPEFADLHPFAPAGDADGTRAIIRDLEAWLASITGYDAVSVQPNAGSQGELAGLLAIRAYHLANGDDHRTVCLIPASAHGTNAASAVMAGMRVIVVRCDDDGNVDVDDLRAKIDTHRDDLAALMVTYPSTHGVYEEAIGEICALVHDGGGQVYLDGANLNALVGLARPGRFGADVSHLNLHKTFCIPHGGGGPGVGPIGVRAHLAPFLPNHPLVDDAGPATSPGPVSAAPWGSAGILTISWAYIRLMGASGLRHATRSAILHANYLAARLDGAYDVLYTGAKGRVAHECILDVRALEKDTGVSNSDIAKRLIDYGFHAPTMSFPVAGTLMVEPTESEPLDELDRFVDAMLAIRGEADDVASGRWAAEDSPLRHAPHTAEDLVADAWEHPYSREDAAFPTASLRADKYFPPVSRVDNAYGDRNLVCACPPVEDLADDVEP